MAAGTNPFLQPCSASPCAAQKAPSGVDLRGIPKQPEIGQPGSAPVQPPVPGPPLSPIYSTCIAFAACSSSPRKSGWAMPIKASARCLAVLPRSWATPYSVTT